jgi:hypothetical protein
MNLFNIVVNSTLVEDRSGQMLVVESLAADVWETAFLKKKGSELPITGF